MHPSQVICGLILAGGHARRMGGGDKCLLPLAGKSLLQRTIDRAQPQVAQLLLNANGNSLRFARSKLPVIPDLLTDKGPLAGIHAGLHWIYEHHPESEWMASFASDTPFFPDNLVKELFAQTDSSTQIVVARTQQQMHPTFALWHVSLSQAIEETLDQEKIPALHQFVESQKHSVVNFDATDYDPFFNVNTPQDLYQAEAIAAKL